MNINDIERKIKLNLSATNNFDQIKKIGKALSTTSRLEILQLLNNSFMSIVEISEKLDIPVSSTAYHIQILEDAGLIITESQPGIRGSMRLCITSIQDIWFEYTPNLQNSQIKTTTIEMPIGHFYDCDVKPTCGIANEKGLVNIYDNPAAFFIPDKIHGQLIWFQQGFIEYRFPNHFLKDVFIEQISFSMEICSEAPGFRDNWPSDITISVNDVEVGMYTCPGDFGSRMGKLTPQAWGLGTTQFGILKNFSIKKSGTFIDDVLYSAKAILPDFKIIELPYISLKIEVKENARYVGGVNIFGDKFGDYPQNILMTVQYI